MKALEARQEMFRLAVTYLDLWTTHNDLIEDYGNSSMPPSTNREVTRVLDLIKDRLVELRELGKEDYEV